MDDKLIWSRYNFLLNSEEKGKLLYNSYTNAFLKLDDSLWDEVKQLVSKPIISNDLLKNYTNEEIKYFKSNYIIVESDNNLVELMHHQSLSRIFGKDHLVLTIAPTQNCNFDCSYCYEKWRTSGSMSDDTENAIIKHLEKQIKENGLKTISLTWYGGEPLLELKRIKTLGKRINELDIELSENEVITNGYMFDDRAVKVFSELNISSVQITLDGVKEIHDKRRPLVGNKGSFNKIIENLDNFFSSNNKSDFIIAVRVNIDKTTKDDYVKMHEWLNKRYPYENCIVYPGWIYLDEDNIKKPICFTRNESTDFCINLRKKEGIIAENMYPDDINMECLARNPNSMIIGWKGEIYKCYEDIGNKELVVGNINNDSIWSNYDLISKYSIGLDHYQVKECRECSYLPICSGGCPLRRFENKYKNKNNDCCTPFKGRLLELLELHYDNK